jgi:hypothetical protein
MTGGRILTMILPACGPDAKLPQINGPEPARDGAVALIEKDLEEICESRVTVRAHSRLYRQRGRPPVVDGFR